MVLYICRCKCCSTVCYKPKMRLHKNLRHPQTILNFTCPCAPNHALSLFWWLGWFCWEKIHLVKWYVYCVLTAPWKYLISTTWTGHRWNSFHPKPLNYMAFSKVVWSNEALRNHRTIESHGLRMASHFDLTLRATQKHLRFFVGGIAKGLWRNLEGLSSEMMLSIFTNTCCRTIGTFETCIHVNINTVYIYIHIILYIDKQI